VRDLSNLLDLVIFNYLVGNCDAHGKNFSLIYNGKDNISLAPGYDILCTIAYPELTTKMAMKIGGEYDINKVSSKNFVQLAKDAELSKQIVSQRVMEIATMIIEQIDAIDVLGGNEIKAIIIERCQKTLRI